MAVRQLTRDAREELEAAGMDRGDRATPGPGPRPEERPASSGRGEASHAGRTSGGGSLGHTPPDEVNDAAPMRNTVPRERERT
jgi:hypothetical protein